MAWIESITYGAFDAQSMDMVGYDVTFSGALLDMKSHDFANAVAAIILDGARSKALRVSGIFPADNSAYHFVKRFREDGDWFIIGVGDGQMTHLWDDFLSYRITRLTRAEWPVLRANEIQWRGALGPEPLLPTPPPKLMLVTDGMTEVDIWRWLKEAKHPWHLLTDRKRAFRRAIL